MEADVDVQRLRIMTCASLLDGLRFFTLAGDAGAAEPGNSLPPGATAHNAVSAAGASPRLVLVVDDDADVLESYARLIERSVRGVVVRTAPNGPRALELLGKEPFALIVSDYRMPGMDGIDFLSLAHKLQPDAVRILVSAYPDRDLEVRAEAEVGQNFLSKASDPSLLIKRITLGLASASG